MIIDYEMVLGKGQNIRYHPAGFIHIDLFGGRQWVRIFTSALDIFCPANYDDVLAFTDSSSCIWNVVAGRVHLKTYVSSRVPLQKSIKIRNADLQMYYNEYVINTVQENLEDYYLYLDSSTEHLPGGINFLVEAHSRHNFSCDESTIIIGIASEHYDNLVAPKLLLQDQVHIKGFDTEDLVPIVDTNYLWKITESVFDEQESIQKSSGIH